MSQIITSLELQINSCSSDFRNPTIAVTPKTLKLHSSDIPFLLIIKHFHTKGNGCYLKPSQWAPELTKYGGKGLGIDAIKQKRSKLLKMGLIRAERYPGPHSTPYTLRLTIKGFEAVYNYKKLHYRPPKKTSSKPKKLHHRNQKTTPPLNSGLINDQDHDLRKPLSVDNYSAEQKVIYERLQEIGFYEYIIIKIIKLYDIDTIHEAYCFIKKIRPNNPGGYMMTILKNIERK